MSSPTPERVTLTGDRAGEYVVLEERRDGSLVIAPSPATPAAWSAKRRPGAAAPGSPTTFGGLLSSLISGSRQAPATVPEMLAGWGVGLAGGESVTEFLAVQADEVGGFVAVTTERFIFVPQTAQGPGFAQEHRLSALRGAQLAGRGLRQRLHLAWDRSDMVITAPRDTLARLAQRLGGG